MKTCLVGVDGLLGSEWINTLTKLKHQIVGVGPSETSQAMKNGFLDSYYKVNFLTHVKNELDELFLKERPINVIFNSGIDAKPGSGKDSLSGYSLDTWKEIFDVNVFGLVQVLNAVTNTKYRPKNVVVIGSMYSENSPDPSLYSHFGERGLTKHPAYSASKFAALGIVKQYASHYASKGLIINMLSPGAIYSNQDSEFVNKISMKIPIKRMANPDELQSMMKFLLEENSYAIGQNFVLDGGMNLW